MSRLLFFQTVNLLANILPRRAAYALALRASAWAFRRRHAIRETTAANLRTVIEYRGMPCDASGLDRAVRRNFDNFAKYTIDFFRVGRLDSAALNKLVKVERLDYLNECRAMNKGVIGLTAHVGNWEMGAHILDANGSPVTAVALRQRSRNLDALFQSRRARRGIHVLQEGGAAVSALTRLNRNELVVMLGDLDFSGHGPRVPFFGKPARLPRGPAVLAARSRAPILPGFVLRQPDDSFLFRVYPPIVPGTRSSIDDIQKRIVAVLEEVIGENPDQWFAFEPVWSDGSRVRV